MFLSHYHYQIVFQFSKILMQVYFVKTGLLMNNKQTSMNAKSPVFFRNQGGGFTFVYHQFVLEYTIERKYDSVRQEVNANIFWNYCIFWKSNKERAIYYSLTTLIIDFTVCSVDFSHFLKKVDIFDNYMYYSSTLGRKYCTEFLRFQFNSV